MRKSRWHDRHKEIWTKFCNVMCSSGTMPFFVYHAFTWQAMQLPIPQKGRGIAGDKVQWVAGRLQVEKALPLLIPPPPLQSPPSPSLSYPCIHVHTPCTCVHTPCTCVYKEHTGTYAHKSNTGKHTFTRMRTRHTQAHTCVYKERRFTGIGARMAGWLLSGAQGFSGVTFDILQFDTKESNGINFTYDKIW